MQDDGVIIGIDLGTTNSVVALMDGSGPVIVANLEGNRITPSVVAWNPGGEVLVGEAARRQAVVNPKRTVSSIKRFMGRRLREMREEAKLVTYELVGGRRGLAKVKIEDREYLPQEVSACVLRKLKASAEAYLGRPVTRAVITVPAYFNDAQRQATMDAGQIAGLKVERILHEPTAAALAYALDKKGSRKIAVVDFGGGTFDVSILQLSDGVFQVVSTSGDTRLGGDDLDRVLVNYVADEFSRETGIDLRRDPVALQRLMEACETAKKELSTRQSTDITLAFITADQHGPKHLQTRVERLQFEQLIAPLIERCCRPILKAFEDANLDPRELNEVVLVGGSCRVPRVVELVREMFNREPCRAINPEEAIAIGAAIQADVLSGRRRDLTLLDVTPLSLGIETRGGFMTRIIDRNTTIPTRRTELFSTSEDNQSIVIIRVYQGEREIAAHNRLLDELSLEGVRPAPQGLPQIEVSFDLDANSILHVTARDLDTGQEQTVRIKDSCSLDEAEVERLRQDAERHDAEDKDAKNLADLRDYCEGICRETETMLQRAGGVDKDIREAIRQLVEHTRKMAQGTSVAVLRAGVAELGRGARDLNAAISQAQTAVPTTQKVTPGASAVPPMEEVIDVDFEIKPP